MLLRRVMENVKDQNWFAVLLDFFIVIFGILIAFQLQAWGERRGAAARAEQSLHQLYEESEVILTHWTDRVRAYDRDIEQQDKVIAALTSGDLGDMTSDEAADDIFRLGFFPSIAVPRRTFDELSSAGLLREIDAPEAIDALVEYYSQLEFIQSQIDHFRPDLENYVYNPDDGMTTHYDTARIERLRIDIDFDTLAADERYLTEALSLLRGQIVFQITRRSVLDAAAEMCVALAEAAGETCEGYAAYEEIRELPEWLTRDTPVGSEPVY